MEETNPRPIFKNIAEIIREAGKMEDVDAAIKFVEDENLKLDDPHTKEDVGKLVNQLSIHIRSVNNEFNYDKCKEVLAKVKPKPEQKDRIRQATEFVKTSVLSKDGDLQDMELFIECEIFDYFIIPKDDKNKMGKIFRNGVKELVKSKRNKNTIGRQVNTPYIDSEFNGLYKLSESDTGNVIINLFYDKIAERVYEKMHAIVFKGNIFSYNGKCYTRDKYMVKAEATRLLKGIMQNENSRDISRRLNDVMTYIENSNIVAEYPFNKHKNAFPVRNGVVVFDFENGTHRLEENADPDTWKFDYVLDVDFNENADSSSIMEIMRKYLYDNPEQHMDVSEVNGRYDYRILLQVPAQAILQAMNFDPYKSLYLFIGPGDSGKTTMIDFYSYFVGDLCKCTIGLDEFTSGDRFVMARKEGKLLNLHDELGYFRMSSTDRVKAMTGGYNHPIQRKGVDGYDGKITTVDVYTANQPAGFNKNVYLDKPFWERWYYVYFPNHFDRNDEFKKNIFTEENKSAFLNEVIKTIMEIRKAKKLTIQKQEWTEVRKQWMQAGNIVHKFLEDNMVYGGRTSFIKEEFYTALKAWVYENKQGDDLLPQKPGDLGDMIELCGGVGDAQRMFVNKGQNQHHCFVLNYTWKPQSKYKKYCPSKGVTDQDILDSYL